MTHEEKEKGLRKIEREEYVQGIEHPFGACFKNQVVHVMVYFFPNAVSLLNDGGQIILTLIPIPFLCKWVTIISGHA